MVCSSGVLALLLSVVVSAPSGPATARQLVEDAQRSYAKGDYPEAARLLEQATKLDPSGRILFNLARAHEKANEVDKAILVYEAYLERPDAELQALKRARKALAELYRRKPPKPAEPEPPKEPVKEPAKEPVKEPPPEVVVEPVKAMDAPKELVTPTAPLIVTPVESPRPLRTVGLVSLISGAVVAGVGAGLGFWAQDTARQVKGTYDPVAKPRLVSEAVQRATFTDVAFVTAGVLGLTGAVFLLVDWLTH